MSEQSPWIIDVKTNDFMAAVVERSQSLPVVVDFWAPWCGPCRTLAPLLEELAEELQGKFLLAKVNIDEEPQLAGAMGVQSIPFVAGFVDGQAVDYFQGAIPREELRQWVESLLPSPTQRLLAEGEELEETEPAAAEAKYRQALQLSPEEAPIKIRLARVLLKQNKPEEAGQLVAQLERRGWLEPEAERLKSELELRAAAEETGGVAQARQAVAASPDDLSLRLSLADALAVERKFSEACEICLDVFARDKYGNGPAARESLLKIFDMMGPSPQTSEYRHRLASLMY